MSEIPEAYVYDAIRTPRWLKSNPRKLALGNRDRNSRAESGWAMERVNPRETFRTAAGL